jgi:hypothetical protein
MPIERHADVTPAVVEVMKKAPDPPLREIMVLASLRSHCPYIDTDAQFGVTKALLGDFIRHDEPHPTEPRIGAPWFSLDYVFVLEPGAAVLPRPPISGRHAGRADALHKNQH